MIRIEDYPIFQNNVSTLKDISKDNHDGNDSYMTESSFKAVNFDKVKETYIQGLSLCEIPASNDALHFSNCGEITFIEFKNSKMISTKIYNVRLKIFDSLLIFTDIIGQGISFTRKNMDYILVYNESKNPIIETAVQESPSRTIIAQKTLSLAKKPLIRFDLERFQNLYFKKVYTYTEKEFEGKFLKNLSNIEERNLPVNTYTSEQEKLNNYIN